MNYITETQIVIEEGQEYIKETTYKILEDDSKEVVCSAKYPKPPDEPIQPEPTQLDRIEEAVQQNYAEAQQEGADAITLEMIERGVI